MRSAPLLNSSIVACPLKGTFILTVSPTAGWPRKPGPPQVRALLGPTPSDVTGCLYCKRGEGTTRPADSTGPGGAVCPLYSSFCGPTWVDGRPSTVPPRRALNSGICGNCFPASDEVPTMFNSLRSRSAPPYGGVLFRRSAGFSGLQGVDASPCYALNCRSLFPVCTREGSRNWRQPAVDSLTHETVHGGWSLRIEVVSVASPPLGGAMQRNVAIEELDTSANVMQRGRSKCCSGFGEKVKDI